MTTVISDAQVRGIRASLESVPSKQLALIHRTIVNAYLLSGSRKFERRSTGGSFWGEMGKDEIHWWVFKKEQDIEGLERETEALIPYAKRLKDDARALKGSFPSMGYEDLVSALDAFVLGHEPDIVAFNGYVSSLAKKDDLAPCILFTYRVWGSTNQGERISVKDHEPVYSEDLLECLETALGLKIRSEPTADWVWMGMKNNSELEEEDFGEYVQSAGADEWMRATSSRVLDQFYAYFDHLLQSLRNILIEISEYRSIENLLGDREFWGKVVTKAMEFPLEDQLWDFKETLPMWHSAGNERLRHEVDVCESIAAFANSNGGVLVIGVSNLRPRRVMGVSDPENRIKHLHDVISKSCKYQVPFFRVTPLSISGAICVLVIVAQTKGVVGVVDAGGKYSYPRRQGTGITLMDETAIQASKSVVLRDNYGFVAELDRITNGGFISFSYN